MTLISELVHPLLSSMTIAQEQSDLDSQLTVKKNSLIELQSKIGQLKRQSLSCLRDGLLDCCKVLFQQLLIFSCFTDSAEEIALSEMDLLFICIGINLTHSGSMCVFVRAYTVCAGGWYGWNLCSLDGAAA